MNIGKITCPRCTLRFPTDLPEWGGEREVFCPHCDLPISITKDESIIYVKDTVLGISYE